MLCCAVTLLITLSTLYVFTNTKMQSGLLAIQYFIVKHRFDLFGEHMTLFLSLHEFIVMIMLSPEVGVGWDAIYLLSRSVIKPHVCFQDPLDWPWSD